MLNSKTKKVWPIIGNKAIINFLKSNIQTKKTVPAYLFVGPKQVGKRTVANIFSKVFFCHDPSALKFAQACENCEACREFGRGIHPDFFVLTKKKDKKNISIEDIRLFQQGLNRTSLLGNIKIGIIDDAADLSIEAGNALLKTLEEPPANSIFILILELPDSLPATLVSRCQVITFRPVASLEISAYLEKNFHCSPKTANKIAALSFGRPGKAIDFLKHSVLLKKYEETVDEFCHLFSQTIPERFALVQKYMARKSFPEKIKQTKEIFIIWLALIRDLLLIKEDKINRVVHSDRLKLLKKIALSFSRQELLENLKALTSFQESLSKNINPQLVIENYFLNLNSYA